MLLGLNISSILIVEEYMNQQHKRAYWEERIQLWWDSGKSQIDFCRENHLVYPTFNYWQRKIACQDSGQSSDALSVVEVSLNEATLPMQQAQHCIVDAQDIQLSIASASLHITGRISIGQLTRLAVICQELSSAANQEQCYVPG
jgi:hypothetical protein